MGQWYLHTDTDAHRHTHTDAHRHMHTDAHRHTHTDTHRHRAVVYLKTSRRRSTLLKDFNFK